MKFRPFRHLETVDVARTKLLAAVCPVMRTETIPIDEASGRVAAERVRAPAAVPAFARATWDGYAVRSSDLRHASRAAPVELRIVGEVFADGGHTGRLRPGEAVAIATGGAMPPTADAIVLFEDVTVRQGRVRIHTPPARGNLVALPGEDFPRGAILVRPGDLLSPAQCGTVAASGRPRVRVYARPRVAIVPNGSELVRPGHRPRHGQIYESNNVTLSAVVRGAGGEPHPLDPVPDDPKRLERALRRAAASSEIVLATGGSSVGERDLLPTVFPRLGRILFHGIAVRPGKPTIATVRGTCLVVGLPGHPTSCLANMFWLVLPVLRKCARLPGPGWVDETLPLGGDAVGVTPGLATVVPISVRAGLAFAGRHHSHAISSLVNISAFAVLPAGRRRVPRGRRIRVHRLLPPIGRFD